MQLELAGKTALVTGSSRGIGNAIAKALHAEGCKVALNGRDETSLTIAARELPGAIVTCGDVSLPNGAKQVVTDAIKGLGSLDILICNVGSGRSVPSGEETYDEWQRMFAINLWSATNTVEAAREALIASSGVILFISSICGLEVVPGAPATYSAAKAALHAYASCIARPFAKDGIRVNIVSPGNVVFPGSTWESKLEKDTASVQAMLDRDVPLRRLGTPEEIADAVIFLVSKRAAFITGANLAIDAGQTRGW